MYDELWQFYVCTIFVCLIVILCYEYKNYVLAVRIGKLQDQIGNLVAENLTLKSKPCKKKKSK